MLQTQEKTVINQEQTELAEKMTIEPIEQASPGQYSPAVKEYFAHYDLDGGWCEAEHLFGSFESAGFTLAAHLYKPAEYTATAVLLHGYLNHTGQFKNLIRYLIEHGFAVAAYDLPGHGLSTGESAAIDTFDQYVQTTQDFMKLVKQHLNGPYYTLGFSTGGSILVDMMLEDIAGDFEKIILAAPLIHWTGYEQSKSTYKVYIKFTKKIPRFYRKNSSNKEYLIFNKTQDYLHCTHLSLEWVKALFDWNTKIESMKPCDRNVLVIQGDQDVTVEWQYNLSLIRNKFPHAEIKMIPGANHELFNEAPAYRQKTLEYIMDCFK